MTMMIIAVQTEIFLQRIVQVLIISLMKNQTQTYSENSSAEQSDNGEEATETNTDESNNSAN